MAPRRREKIVYEARKHGIVLAGSIVRALLLAGVGAVLVAVGWPYSAGGLALMSVAALYVLRAVARWDRTKLVLTDERLYIAFGVLRRQKAAVPLSSIGAVEIEQTLIGRLLGYGTLTAGELEIDFVPRPAELDELVAELAA